jgi:hypothetical protein
MTLAGTRKLIEVAMPLEAVRSRSTEARALAPRSGNQGAPTDVTRPRDPPRCACGRGNGSIVQE